uniref:Uncharacterized protein n=1 Tax=Panagrolaimus sp. PS1159 TaxID=55785 RepID=A0AC35ERG6_9BILA
MKLIIVFILINVVFLNFAFARSLQDLYEAMEVKLFEDIRQKDFKPIGASPPAAFVEVKPQPPILPAKIGFGKLTRGKSVPFQLVGSSAKDAELIKKPKTVSTIMNRLRAGRL